MKTLANLNPRRTRNTGILSAKIQRDLPESSSLLAGLRDIRTIDRARTKPKAFAWLPSKSQIN